MIREIERLPLPRPSEILDFGCGNGLFLPRLAQRGSVTGIEVDESLITEEAPFRERIFSEPLGSESYRDRRFDLITALDVIEHIEDDSTAINHLVEMLNPGGHLVITVPAFTLLWDEHDVVNQHFRRYRAKDLEKLLAGHGQLVKLRYLFASLFPLKLAIATLNRIRTSKIAQATLPGRVSSRVIAAWLRLEDRATERLRLPLGTSVIAVLRKPWTP